MPINLIRADFFFSLSVYLYVAAPRNRIIPIDSFRQRTRELIRLMDIERDEKKKKKKKKKKGTEDCNLMYIVTLLNFISIRRINLRTRYESGYNGGYSRRKGREIFAFGFHDTRKGV